MTIRRTDQSRALPETSAGPLGAPSKCSVEQGVDATRAAAEVAHGSRPIETIRGMVSARTSEMAFRVSLAQAVDSAAIEAKALLGRMRLIAEQGVVDGLPCEQQQLLQQEFEMLQSEMDSLVRGASAGGNHYSEFDSGDACEELSPRALKVDAQHARVDSSTEAEWALFRIDQAETSIDSLRDEFGTIEERVDAAIAELTAYVDSTISADRRLHTTAEAMEAAHRTRLQLMQRDGLAPSGQAEHLQQSVIALLQ